MSLDQKQAPQRRLMIRFNMVLSLMITLVALGLAAFVYRLQAQALEMMARLKKDEVALNVRYETLQAEYQKVARARSFLKAVGDNRQSSVHARF